MRVRARVVVGSAAIAAATGLAAAGFVPAGAAGAAVPAAPGATLTAPPRSVDPGQPCGVGKAPKRWRHVVWIVMENHGWSQTVGSPVAPYFNSLARRCGLAQRFFAITHPSLPNYLAMVSGSTHGVADSGKPAAHPLAGPSIFSQLGPGRWRTLAESMPSNCHRDNAGDYVARHNPATYFTNLGGQCEAQDVPLSDDPDISAPFTMIVPDNRSNTHDTDVAHGDAWLAGFVPKLLASKQYRAGRTAVFITYDEDSGIENNHIPTLVVAPSVQSGIRVKVRYSLYSLLRTTEAMLGLPKLGKAAAARSMRRGFGL